MIRSTRLLILCIFLLPAPTLNPPSGITQMNIDLSWSNVTGNYGYRIERSTDNVNWAQLILPGVDVTAYSDSSVVPNQLYYYRVSTKNSAGAFSVVSNVKSATTQAVPSPTLNALSGVTQMSIDLSWVNVAGNAGYGAAVNWKNPTASKSRRRSSTSSGLKLFFSSSAFMTPALMSVPRPRPTGMAARVRTAISPSRM